MSEEVWGGWGETIERSQRSASALLDAIRQVRATVQRSSDLLERSRDLRAYPHESGCAQAAQAPEPAGPADGADWLRPIDAATSPTLDLASLFPQISTPQTDYENLGASRRDALRHIHDKAEQLLILAEAYELQEVGFFCDLLRRTANEEAERDEG